MNQYNKHPINQQVKLKLFVRSENIADTFVFPPKNPRGIKIGHIDRKKDTFFSIPRDRSNLFHLFADNKRTSGLGISNELLQKGKFTYIEIPYEGKTLRTTKEHFLKHSIPSPYHNHKIEFQRILPLNLFVVPEPKEEAVLDLFEQEVS